MNAHAGNGVQGNPCPFNDSPGAGLYRLTEDPALSLHLRLDPERYARERIAQLEATVANLQCALKDAETQRDELREQSVRDPLTALFNRRHMDQTLEQEVARARRYHTSLAFLLLDIDDFKLLNDRFGHVAGDMVLREVGQLILANIRAGDVACRYGGDEFIVVMPETSLEAAAHRGEQLRGRARQLRLEFADAKFPEIRLSMGVAVLPEHGGSAIELLKRADAALYQAKRCLPTKNFKSPMPPQGQSM